MVAQFCQFINSEKLFSTDDRLLVAVSGGLDSTTLVHLLAKGGYTFSIAHCNFQLRGKDSDGDAQFVRQLAEELDVSYHEVQFDTQNLRQAGESIQMCARRLRYDWLLALLENEPYAYLLTAHHLYDSLETMLLNFSRGTGLAGMQGIPVQTEVLRRPLLFCGRPQLAAWVHQEGIAFREDASNAEEKYRRNRIRHQILPILEELNPALADTLYNNFSHLRSAYSFYRKAIDAQIKTLLQETPEGWQIDRQLLLAHPEAQTLLYECLLPFGFDGEQVKQLLGAKTGTVLESASHLVLADSHCMDLRPKRDQQDLQLKFSKTDKAIRLPNETQLFLSSSNRPEHFSDNPQAVFVDADKLIYPLLLRFWQIGDEFQPLGMSGKHQKLQDFFVNNKINRLDRNQIPLLFNGNDELIWIIGHRLDERYKLRPETEQVLLLTLASG